MSLTNLDLGLEKPSSSKSINKPNNKFNNKNKLNNKYGPDNKSKLLKKDKKNYLIYF